jgi:hypothetical protein
MADTGNPWFIPFAEPSDLVRDWPALSSAVGTAVAAGLSAAGNPGIGSNVVQTVKTNLFNTTSTSVVDVTGTDCIITPTSDTSKVLVVITGSASVFQAGSQAQLFIRRETTNIGVSTGATNNATHVQADTTDSLLNSFTLCFLDSPATDSAVTYRLGVRVTTGGTARIGGNNSTPTFGAITTVTAIEVAA